MGHLVSRLNRWVVSNTTSACFIFTMEKKELIRKLKKTGGDDTETSHLKADELLLEFIDDKEIEETYNNIPKWYA